MSEMAAMRRLHMCTCVSARHGNPSPASDGRVMGASGGRVMGREWRSSDGTRVTASDIDASDITDSNDITSSIHVTASLGAAVRNAL